MTDLMNALYIFAQERRVMAYLHDDREYHDAQRYVEKRLEQFRETLSPEQFSQLEILLDEQLTVFSAEADAYFQAGFSIAMELNRHF